jgi:thioesterase domain-containing protein
MGGEVALLAMFDTYGPEGHLRAARAERLPLRRWWAAYRKMTAEQRLHARQRIAFRLFKLPLARLMFWLGRKGLPLPMAMRIRQVEQANFRALMRYRPEPYDGGMVLYRASEARDGDDATLGWQRWIRGQVEVVEIAGRHDNLIGQPQLAKELRERIERVLRDRDQARAGQMPRFGARQPSDRSQGGRE